MDIQRSDDDGGDVCVLLELAMRAGSAEGVGATKAEQPGRSNDEAAEPSLFFWWPVPRITEISAAAAYLAMIPQLLTQHL